MFKIKSLLYEDLISNSRGCRKSNQLLRHPHRCCVEPPPSMAEATPQMPPCVQKQEPATTLFVMEDKNYARERAAKRSPTAQAGILL